MRFELADRVNSKLGDLKFYIESNIGSNSLYNNQRTVADKIEELCKEFFRLENFRVDEATSNRSVEDFKLEGELVDAKTHSNSKSFSMPQIISFWRYKNLLDEDGGIDTNLFELIVSYRYENDLFIVEDIKFDSFFNLDTSCIRIDNLGNGLIQLNTSKGEVYIFQDNDIHKFNRILNDKYIEYCNKQIDKIKKNKEKVVEIEQE